MSPASNEAEPGSDSDDDTRLSSDHCHKRDSSATRQFLTENERQKLRSEDRKKVSKSHQCYYGDESPRRGLQHQTDCRYTSVRENNFYAEDRPTTRELYHSNRHPHSTRTQHRDHRTRIADFGVDNNYSDEDDIFEGLSAADDIDYSDYYVWSSKQGPVHSRRQRDYEDNLQYDYLTHNSQKYNARKPPKPSHQRLESRSADRNRDVYRRLSEKSSPMRRSQETQNANRKYIGRHRSPNTEEGADHLHLDSPTARYSEESSHRRNRIRDYWSEENIYLNDHEVYASGNDRRYSRYLGFHIYQVYYIFMVKFL